MRARVAAATISRRCTDIDIRAHGRIYAHDVILAHAYPDRRPFVRIEMDDLLAGITETERPRQRIVAVPRETFERECLREWRPVVERYDASERPRDTLREAQCSYYLRDMAGARRAAETALQGTLKKSEREEMTTMMRV